MSQDTLELANRELKEWQEKLRQTEAYRKVKLWEEVIRSYGGSVVINGSGAKKPPVAPEDDLFSAGKKKTIKAQVTGLAAECIRNNGGYAHLAKINSYLEEHGIKIENTSWYLSTNKDIFVPDRTKGWSLV